MAGPWMMLVAAGLLFVVIGLAIGLVVVVVSTSHQRQSNNPNLLPCEDCGNMVSLRARSCPRCGCPMDGK